MSFSQMKRDELYELAVNNFAVEVAETATKPQIIAALAEEGVTWEMAKTFDQNAAAVAAEDEGLLLEEPKANPNVITSASTRPTPEVVSIDPVVEEAAVEFADLATAYEETSAVANDLTGVLANFILVPKGLDGVVQGGVFFPNAAPAPVVLQDITSTDGRAPFRNRPAGVGVLVKMERENPHYETRGYTFTQKNPFAVVTDADADHILTHEEGFKVASPREAKEFYG